MELLRTWTREPSQGFVYRLGAVYIDVSFLPPPSSPQLDIFVVGQSNHYRFARPYVPCPWPRLTEFVIYTL